MSLGPRQSLSTILDNVALEQDPFTERILLASPMHEILADDESKLICDVIIVEQGLLWA